MKTNMNSEMDLLSLLESDKIVKIMWLSPKIDFARFDVLLRVKLRYYTFGFFKFNHMVALSMKKIM